jgi:hypothetical protein
MKLKKLVLALTLASAFTTAKLNTVSASAIYAADNNSSLIAKLVVQEQNGLTSNKLMIIGRINF